MAEAQVGPLVAARGLHKAYGAQVLFEGVSLALSEGDRLGVIGPNGSGKTTLVRILAGEERPDAGSVAVRRDARLAWVPQDPAFAPGATVESVLRAALDAALPPGPDHVAEAEARLNETLGRAGFEDRSRAAATLSGGWQKRLAIARALVADPDVLLLDEPTNHLDLPGLSWLEDLLRRARFATLLVSHDRWFLQGVANRVMELNRAYPGGTLSADGDYGDFLEAREDFLARQARRQETLENRVRRETEWLRRGPKARATKAQYRVDEALRLQEELAEVAARNVVSGATFDFTGTERRTRRLLVARDLSFTLPPENGDSHQFVENDTVRVPGRVLFRDLSFVLSPGTRLGLVGANGSGKTTLLKVLAGVLDPGGGRVERAPGLRTVYFDQQREALDPALPLQRAFAPDGDAVRYRDQEIHVASWARRFGFRQDQLTTPVGRLSGGEQARVLVARLVVRPADVLLLDEPTNDLDLPTLEVLEDSLADFPGAVVLVTHDRYLLDRASTTVLGLDGRGGAAFHGDFRQWEEAAREAARQEAGARQADEAARRAAVETAARPKPRRLTYLEQKDWETIEARIRAAEEALAAREAALHDPAIATDAAGLGAASRAADEARAAVEALYDRWAELEGKMRPDGDA